MRIKLFTFLVILLYCAPALAQETTYYIKVRTTKLRNAMQHFAPAVSELKLGESVSGQAAENGWFKVRTKTNRTGYLHGSTLSERKIVANAAKGYNPASDSSDIVLAGKGFNSEVEKEYASLNPSLNYAEVDSMEKINIKDSDLISFAKVGGLKSDG